MVRRFAIENGTGILDRIIEPPALSNWELAKWMAREHIRPQRWRIIFSFFCMGVMAAATTGMAKMLEPIVNAAFFHKSTLELNYAALIIVGVFFIRGWATFGQTTTMNYVGQSIIASLQRQLFRHIIASDLAFFNRQSPGALISRFLNDVGCLRGSVTESLGALGACMQIIGLGGLMFYQDWRLAIVTFLVLPFAVFPIRRIGKRVRRVSRNQQMESGQLSTALDEAFQGVRQVKAHAMEAHEEARVGRAIGTLFRLSVKSARIRALANPALETLGGLAIAGVLLYGGRQVISSVNTPGAFFSFIAAVFLVYEPLKRLTQSIATLQEGFAAAERIRAVIDKPPTVVDMPGAPALKIGRGAVTLNDVTFTYGGESLAIDRLNLEIPAGGTVALVGPSGAGKSTIFNLILRFFDPDAGRVAIDGQDLRQITMASLRGAIALVSQDSLLFDDTIKDNILYGRMGASDADIERAAVAAHAHDFIRQLPHGYDTPVGPRGVRLSGGQRQRILIARAMLRDAPILLLDEATSSLDNESERIVKEAIQRLKRGRTTVVIAHRLSTVVAADCIYVMEHGRVVEQGRHNELMSRDGVYARLYAQQFVDEYETPPAREAVG
jgi:ATP-binding cassette, subfamily B, bacterial MsbA